MPSELMEVSQFERFFRDAAGIDVDKSDLKRFSQFVFREIYDLLVRGAANAKANVRDLIEPWDLPITKGLQERINEFKKMDESVELRPILDDLVARPQLEVTWSEETEQQLPIIAGGLGVALARTFTIIDTRVKNPSSKHWERAFRLFDVLL